ncbi:hypothetical protein SARC_07660 [Sphaeroforma arctica JP610]|uniref:DNA repair protein RAD16 n=1 Tax=Sphaeroforma arctica JP610 TaxID=667725 RepID=A0A0L0FTQ7_9EUKA|nr:hypothetical protein SARC_07660 [Sphaeroforma arctica JP610]KNC79961.1 hypothetical protein SARC_07660 [Sphaeroforma arctica JP610]|eukprot:XP_014153863.1 hypothetical protein SARC_07660 [Sphaeroforma arctica JP610]
MARTIQVRTSARISSRSSARLAADPSADGASSSETPAPKAVVNASKAKKGPTKVVNKVSVVSSDDEEIFMSDVAVTSGEESEEWNPEQDKNDRKVRRSIRNRGAASSIAAASSESEDYSDVASEDLSSDDSFKNSRKRVRSKSTSARTSVKVEVAIANEGTGNSETQAKLEQEMLRTALKKQFEGLVAVSLASGNTVSRVKSENDVEAAKSVGELSDVEVEEVVVSEREVSTKEIVTKGRKRFRKVKIDSEEDEEQVDAKGKGIKGKKNTRAKKPKVKKLTRDEKIHKLHPEVQGVWEGSEIDARVNFLSETNKVKRTLIEGGPKKAAQPEHLKLTLLPFQTEGVAWMIDQEKTEFHGGILADEMGMGKTIQTIALLLSDFEQGHTSLIICPTVALMQWRNEVLKHVKDEALKVCVFHGSGRTTNHKDLLKYNVVLSTYSVLESEYRRETKGMGKELKRSPSTLHKIHWHRIILDEAHNIKDRSSSSARAALSLNSSAKWSLSGTPLQNRVGELYSLIRFMRTFPYSYYFCSKCECKSLFWKFTDYKHCDTCGCSPMSHFCWWNKEILRPIQKYGNYGPGRVGFVKLGALLEKIMLRRTKLEKADDLGLPPRIVVRKKVWFNEEELDFYKALYSQSRTKFLTYVSEGVLLNNYAHIFDLLMKMRQAANHPYLVLYGRGRISAGDAQDVCGVCQEDAEDPIRAKCKHVFCREDIKMYLQSSIDGQVPQCPVCFVPLSIDLSQPTISQSSAARAAASQQRQSILNRMDIGGWKSSSKVEALIEQLALLREKEGTTIKTIVFSQYVSFLDIIEWRLLRSGFRCVKLDGRMSPEQRAAVIDAFMTNHTVTIFLVSLKAGGVALNLTEASRVIMCDPWWNPAVENQAMDRIHRLGQTRPIEVIRLYVENSIESRIIALQEKKHLLFESTIGMDPASLNRLSEEDLGFLFQL